MFRIGEFSKLCLVSVKALRLYDQLGLLRPTRVDPFTDYRYYSADQLPRLNRILALKDLGFTLEQIAPLLDDHVSAEQLRGMLRLKRAEAQRELADVEARLARVEARLRQVEMEGTMTTQEVVIKNIPAQTVTSVRRVIPTYADIGQLFTDLYAYIGQHGIRPLGPPMALYFDKEFKERDPDVAVAVPVAAGAQGSAGVQVHALPAVETMACIVHKGTYDTLHEAYSTLTRWMEQNGYIPVGPNREIYLTDPGAVTNPADNVTEIQLPVAKAATN